MNATTEQINQLKRISEERRGKNLETINKINVITNRTRELFEQKYTRLDWEQGNKEVIEYFDVCKAKAIQEIIK